MKRLLTLLFHGELWVQILTYLFPIGVAKFKNIFITQPLKGFFASFQHQ